MFENLLPIQHLRNDLGFMRYNISHVMFEVQIKSDKLLNGT